MLGPIPSKSDKSSTFFNNLPSLGTIAKYAALPSICFATIYLSGFGKGWTEGRSLKWMNPPQIRKEILSSIGQIVGESKVLPRHVDIASLGMKEKNPEIQARALDLFQLIVSEEGALPEAIEAAEKGIRSEAPFVLKGALNLISLLVQEGKEFSEAVDIAKKVVDTSLQRRSEANCFEALHLLATFASKGKALEEAKDAAVKTAERICSLSKKSSSTFAFSGGNACAAALSVFEELVRQGFALEEAKKAVCQSSGHLDVHVSLVRPRLLSELNSKGIQIDESLDCGYVRPSYDSMINDLYGGGKVGKSYDSIINDLYGSKGQSMDSMVDGIEASGQKFLTSEQMRELESKGTNVRSGSNQSLLVKV
jgi:hypothetical protein